MTAGIVVEHLNRDAIAEVETLLAERLDRAAERLRLRTAENISRRATASDDYSQPGEFPRTDDGNLRRSLFVETTDNLVRRIATDLPYGLLLETGTRDMAPRPYLTRTLSEIAAELGDIIATEEVPQ